MMKPAIQGRHLEEEMQGFTIERLEPGYFRQAFPLIQLKHKALTIGQWTTYAERITDTNNGSQRGLLAARNHEGVICRMPQITP